MKLPKIGHALKKKKKLWIIPFRKKSKHSMLGSHRGAAHCETKVHKVQSDVKRPAEHKPGDSSSDDSVLRRQSTPRFSR